MDCTKKERQTLWVLLITWANPCSWANEKQSFIARKESFPPTTCALVVGQWETIIYCWERKSQFLLLSLWEGPDNNVHFSRPQSSFTVFFPANLHARSILYLPATFYCSRWACSYNSQFFHRVVYILLIYFSHKLFCIDKVFASCEKVFCELLLSNEIQMLFPS
jgi:hypothetical protein